MSDLETIAAEPHYHVWTLYEVAMPWPAFGGGWETMRTMAYISERTPYAVRSTAWRQLPRFDARPSIRQERRDSPAMRRRRGLPVSLRTGGALMRAKKMPVGSRPTGVSTKPCDWLWS